MHWCPKKSVLQSVVAAIRARTWERINGALRDNARQLRFEPARRIRIDATATDSPIHEPSDSSLLWDAVRVMVRLLNAAERLPGAPSLEYINHKRVAKKRSRAIWYARGASNRRALYIDLLKVTRNTLAYLDGTELRLSCAGLCGIEFEGWIAQVRYFKPLIQGVISQTERRVLKAEKVAAADKVLSLFEPHTDILVKGSRPPHYGHKLTLVSGRSGLILDVVIESGNPSDSERFVPMLERHAAHYGFDAHAI